MSGFSLYFCYGPYAGFMVENGNTVKRIVLGKIAFGFIKLDIEVVMDNYIDLSEKYKELLNE